MEVEINRFRFTDKNAIGHMNIDGERFCYTLEDKVREVPGQPVSLWKVKGQTAIPTGRYRLAMTMSGRFGRVMLQAMDVEGFEGIRIHSGMTDADTEGCPLVGDTVTPTGISGGKLRGVLEKLEARVQAALDAGEEAWLTVTGVP